jgi:hypothetical protein
MAAETCVFHARRHIDILDDPHHVLGSSSDELQRRRAPFDDSFTRSESVEHATVSIQ